MTDLLSSMIPSHLMRVNQSSTEIGIQNLNRPE
jgi:hypothetical protein